MTALPYLVSLVLNPGLWLTLACYLLTCYLASGLSMFAWCLWMWSPAHVFRDIPRHILYAIHEMQSQSGCLGGLEAQKSRLVVHIMPTLIYGRLLLCPCHQCIETWYIYAVTRCVWCCRRTCWVWFVSIKVGSTCCWTNRDCFWTRTRIYSLRNTWCTSRYFLSFKRSESWEIDNLPRDLVSLSNGSGFCELDSLTLAVISFNTVVFPLEDLDSALPLMS